jgi:antitoxin CptB
MVLMMSVNEDPLAPRRRKLAWRATHRGTKEMDLVMTAFVKEHLAGLDEAGLEHFEAVIGLADSDLMEWLNGRAEPPAELINPVLEIVLGYRFTVADYRDLA